MDIAALGLQSDRESATKVAGELNKFIVHPGGRKRRTTGMPKPLNGWASYQVVAMGNRQGQCGWWRDERHRQETR